MPIGQAPAHAGPASDQEQYGYNPDRMTPRDPGLRVVQTEAQHDALRNPHAHLPGQGAYVKGVSQVYVVKEFPKMAYRKTSTGVEARQVANASEEAAARKTGWATTREEVHAILDPVAAVKKEEPETLAQAAQKAGREF